MELDRFLISTNEYRSFKKFVLPISENFEVMGRLFYHYVLKRTSTFCLAMVSTAMFFERAYDHACEMIFEKWNEGVS